MPIALVTGPANAGKAEVVMDSVRRHVAHGAEPLLVVPTRADVEHYRRELAGDGAMLGARVERFAGLIGELVARAGVGGPVLGGLARELTLAAIAGEHSSPGMIRALGALIAELQVRRVSPGRLAEAVERWVAADGRQASTGGLGELYAAYHRALREARRGDREQCSVRALDELRRAPARWGSTPVLFYGFDDLTRLQLDTIETLGVLVGASVTVSLTYEPGRTAFAGRAGTFQALLPLTAEHRELPAQVEHYAPASRAALSHLERSLFEPGAGRVDPGEAVRLLEGGGERAELELVASDIRALLRDGMEPSEIAVAMREPARAADLLAEVFSAAAIPFAAQQRRPFADTAIGSALVGLLRCASAGSGEAGDLLAWLRAPGLLEHPELADGLEVSVRRRGTTDAEQARELWEQRHWKLETIDRVREAGQRSSGALIERAGRELQWLFSAPRRRQASLLGPEELDEARALAAAGRALGELAELARSSPRLAPHEPRALADVLQRLEFLSGEPPGEGTVAVLDPLALRARRVRALFLCGLQEGFFPAPGRPQPFLSEEERRRLAEVSGLALAEHQDALAAERYLLYAAVSRPQELLVLSWHTARDDGAPEMPSLFLDDVCDLFEESLRANRARRTLGAVDMPAAPARPQAPRPLQPLSDVEVLAELRGRTWSASSLQKWMGCPVSWLVERVLVPERFEPDPEPLARGGLAHAALKDTFDGLRREAGAARLSGARLELARGLLRASLTANAGDYPLSTVPERVPGLRRRLEVDLERFLEHAAEAADAAESELEATHLELGFGFEPGDERGEGSNLPPFDLGGGVMLRGRIDRVDVSASGEAVVYDYKGASVTPAAKWIAGHEVQIGLYMRVVEELLGVRAVGGLYQPLRGRDLRPRGVLEGDSEVRVEAVGGDRKDHEEVRELLDEVIATALAAAAEAGRGEIEPRPPTCAYRGGCMYPTICRCERL